MYLFMFTFSVYKGKFLHILTNTWFKKKKMYFNFHICICEYAHRCLMRTLDPLEVEGGGRCEQSDMCSGDPIQVLYKQ